MQASAAGWGTAACLRLQHPDHGLKARLSVRVLQSIVLAGLRRHHWGLWVKFCTWHP